MTMPHEPTTPPADATTGQAGGLDDDLIRRKCQALTRDSVFAIFRIIGRQGVANWREVYAAIEADHPGGGDHAVNTCALLADVGLIELVVSSGVTAYRLNRPGLASFAAAISALGQGKIGGRA